MVSLGSPLAHGPRAETPSDAAQLALIAGRLCSAEAAVEAVKPGNRVFVGRLARRQSAWSRRSSGGSRFRPTLSSSIS